MPFYYKVKKSGGRWTGYGAFEDAEWAEENRELHESRLEEGDEISPGVYEAPANHLRDRTVFPVPVGNVVHADGLEYVHWSDGTEEPLVTE